MNDYRHRESTEARYTSSIFAHVCGVLLSRCSQVDDGALTFGVVSRPLRALESMVRAVYQPMLDGQDVRLWGKAPPDTVHEFMASLEVFVDNLQVSMTACSGEGESRVGYRDNQ